MSEILAENIPGLYESVAVQFDRDRTKTLMEKSYLEKLLAGIKAGRRVLDLGCGSGEPIAKFFIEAGCKVTGVDIAPAMLAMCRTRFPDTIWIEADMRTLALHEEFDAIIAWDSFFHLSMEDQRAMFPIFARHVAPDAMLLFTSGTANGSFIGNIYGQDLYHASLDPEEYRLLLAEHGFEVITYNAEDPNCGRHTVWLTKKLR
jgi:ubiquinone/menaquinone biosynthesis C-methylase UbiE